MMNYKFLFLVLNKETKQLSAAVYESESLDNAERQLYTNYSSDLYFFFVEVYFDVIVPLDPEAAEYDRNTGFCMTVSRGRRVSNDND